MKTFFCLFATVCACNATLQSLFGGSSHNIDSGSGSSDGTKITYNVIATPTSSEHSGVHGSGHSYSAGGSYRQRHDHSYAHDYGYGGKQDQIIKVILADKQGYSNGAGNEGDGSGYSYGLHVNDYGYSNAPEIGKYNTQIFKVVEQQSAPPHSFTHNGGHSYAANYLYLADGYDHSQGLDHSHSYSHKHGHASSDNSQLNAILPQILQLVLQENSLGGGDEGAADGAITSRLIQAYGLKGKASVMRAEGKTGGFIQGGHVVQRGTLKVMRLENSINNGGANVNAQSGDVDNHGHGQDHGLSGSWSSTAMSSEWNPGHASGGWAAKPASGGW